MRKERVASGIRHREICPGDIAAVADLLTKGFRVRPREFWLKGLQRLTERPAPAGFPRYGYLLASHEAIVGVVLQIYSTIVVDGEETIRCNFSSWYTDPALRFYAPMLTSAAERFKNVTYTNLTPAPWTWSTIEAQGYCRYSQGHFIALPALSTRSLDVQVRLYRNDRTRDSDLPEWEADLLSQHAELGCISVTCNLAGRSYPFVFLQGCRIGRLPCTLLIYCREVAEFVSFAGSLGRFLAKRGSPLVALDADGPVKGLVGRYVGSRPKYFKGPHRPRLGDLAFSERVLFRF